MIEDHPYLDKEVDYDDGKRKCTGIVTGVKYAGLLTSGTTKKDLKIEGKSIKIRIKPNDGSRAFWSAAMKDES